MQFREKTSAKIAASLEEESLKIFAKINEIANYLSFGNFGKRKKGDGDDFWQFRQLNIGESANKIDWRRSAKTNQIFVKEKEAQNPKRFQFWIDARPPMHWSSSPVLEHKFNCAQVLAIGIYLALRKIGQSPSFIGHLGSPSSIDEILGCANNLGKMPPTANKAGEVILVSDGIEEIDIWRARIANIKSRGGQPLIIIIQDPIEIGFDISGRVLFSSMAQSQEKVQIEDCQSIRKSYLERYNNHFQALQTMASEMEVPIFFHISGADYLPIAKQIWQVFEAKTQRRRLG
mgnify:CR=1 FL=1